MSGEARRDVDLVGHRVIELDPRKGGHPPFQNVIIKHPDPAHKWLEPASRAIGEWRASRLTLSSCGCPPISSTGAIGRNPP